MCKRKALPSYHASSYVTRESAGESHAKMAWKRSSSTFFVYIPTLNFGCWTAALPRSFFFLSFFFFFLAWPGLARPCLAFASFYLFYGYEKMQIASNSSSYSSTAGDLPYPASRGSRSLLTNITKFWREAQKLK